MGPRTKRKTTKRRVRHSSEKHSFWSYFIILLIALCVGVFTYFLLNYLYGKSDNNIQTINKIEKYLDRQKQEIKKDSIVKSEQKPQEKIKNKEPNLEQKTTIKDLNLTDNESLAIKNMIKSMEDNDTNLYVNSIKSKEHNVTKHTNKIHIEIVEKNITKKRNKKDTDKNQKFALDNKKASINKPKLVIIIDDIAYKHQVDAVKAINLKLTPSIFPPTKHHPDTPKLAKRFKFYMIHLPMQAHGFKKEEINTLHINDSYDKILKRLRDIKRDFPELKYINNHTGSKFTSNFDAMDRLMKAIKNENLIFIDSKTIANTKVAAAAKKHSMPYISRDVFLDHEDNKAAITKQLKYAVAIAKKHSRAIAIGHPYKNTMEVLRNSFEILKDVEVVYLKDIL
ncbi:divergent polysaccharide deacetylase family protein [Campylobacter sp. RM16192]|uniref:divergent polysaccharide deacetylase family protein n=1 Tax=Campylobacter sp. RM16192 TaxID=1660080 RepID=UPI00145114EA|nr:divergent polysaccharide deacetylase family protein [Campylobacter sp. RM16192]QCD52899.1 divergent polysaccharide deacetylase [Campylobacter sp. RM16192]